MRTQPCVCKRAGQACGETRATGDAGGMNKTGGAKGGEATMVGRLTTAQGREKVSSANGAKAFAVVRPRVQHCPARTFHAQQLCEAEGSLAPAISAAASSAVAHGHAKACRGGGGGSQR